MKENDGYIDAWWYGYGYGLYCDCDCDSYYGSDFDVDDDICSDSYYYSDGEAGTTNRQIGGVLDLASDPAFHVVPLPESDRETV